MSDSQVLEMPIRRFWLMLNCISRISAERDMRALTIGSMSQASPETANEYRQQLVLEVGHVARVTENLDREGLSRLKSMA